MNISPRNRGLLRELHRKKDALELKREALVQYFELTKGHDYRRAPHLEKLDALIEAIEAEIRMIDPPEKQAHLVPLTSGVPSTVLTSSSGCDDNTVEGASERDPELARNTCLARFDSDWNNLVQWMTESLLTSNVDDGTSLQEDTVGARDDGQRRATDASFFAFVVGSLSQPLIDQAVLAMPRVPSLWKIGLLLRRPLDAAELLDVPKLQVMVSQALVGNTAVDHSLIWMLLTHVSHDTAARVFQGDSQQESVMAEAKTRTRGMALLQSILDDGSHLVVRSLCFGEGYHIMRRCLSTLSAPVERNVSFNVHEHPRIPSASRCPVPTRPSTATTAAEVAAHREAHQASWCLFESTRRLAEIHETTFLYFPRNVLHRMMAFLYRKEFSATLVQRASEEVDAIHNLCSVVFRLAQPEVPVGPVLSGAAGAAATAAATAPLVAKRGCHAPLASSSDVLQDMRWLTHLVIRKATDRRRECAVDLDRTAEDKFWGYFVNEVERTWTDPGDEHVVAAFVVDDVESVAQEDPRHASPSTPFTSHSRRRSSANFSKSPSGMSKSPSFYVAPADTSAAANDNPARLLRPVALFPHLSNRQYTVSDLCVVHRTNLNLATSRGDLDGLVPFRRTVLNVAADVALLSDSASFRVRVPVLYSNDHPTGTAFRVGWAPPSFPLGLHDAPAVPSEPNSTCLGGGSQTGIGASIVFQRRTPDAGLDTISIPGSNTVTASLSAPSSPVPLHHTSSAVSMAFSLGQSFDAGDTHFTVVWHWNGNALPQDEEFFVSRDGFATQESPSAEHGLKPSKRDAEEVDILVTLDLFRWEMSLKVGDSDADISFVVPHSERTNADTPWFPALTIGCSATSTPEPPATTTALPGVRLPPEDPLPHHFSFDFIVEDRAVTHLLPKHRIGCLLRVLQEYVDTIVTFQSLLASQNAIPSDAVVATLHDRLSAYVESHLYPQINAFQSLPPFSSPKVLASDDAVDLFLPSEMRATTLQRLKLSDRSAIEGPYSRDRERDARWFPGALTRLPPRSRSRYGSMRALEKTAALEEWSILVEQLTDVQGTPLHAAIALGFADIADLMSRNQAIDVNAVDSQGNTALMLAILHGLPNVASTLLTARNASARPQNNAGHTALHIALANQQLPALDLLLQHRGAISTVEINTLTRTKSNGVLLAAKHGRSDLVSTFLQRGGSPCLPDLHQVTALMYALRHGNVAMARNILEYAQHITIDQVNAREKLEPRGTAILYAANIGAADVVRQLLSLGAETHFLFSTVRCSVLHCAVVSRSYDTLAELLSHPTIQRTPAFLNSEAFERGLTAMHLAAELGELRMCEMLFDARADVNATDTEGRTVLMLALLSTAYDEGAVVKFATHVKSRLKAEVVDRNGRSALFYAVAKGSLELASVLVESCRASVNTMDSFGYTPFTFALVHNQDAVAEGLMHLAGTKINFTVARPNVPQPLDLAYQRGSVRVCRMILELGERCLAELRSSIMAAEHLARKGQIGEWGDRRVPPNADLLYTAASPTAATTARFSPLSLHGHVIEVTVPPLVQHGSCAKAILAWYAQHAGDPQHQRISSSCYGLAATLRPTVGERLAQKMLDLTATGDEAILLLQRLDSSGIAVPRRGQTVSSSPSGTTSAPSTKRNAYMTAEIDSDVLDIDTITFSAAQLHSEMSDERLVEVLLPEFSALMPHVKTEKTLRLATTQVLVLLMEARANAARHAHLPLCCGGYEMGIPRLEALAFQALQLNREASVVYELEAIERLAREHGRAFDINTVSMSKWRGRQVTLLHLAVLSSNPAAVRYLLAHGADLLLEPNNDPSGVTHPLADLDWVWSGANGSEESPQSPSSPCSDVSFDAAGSPQYSLSHGGYLRIPCAAMCAIRLAQDDIVLSILAAVNQLPSTVARAFRLDVPEAFTVAHCATPSTAPAKSSSGGLIDAIPLTPPGPSSSSVDMPVGAARSARKTRRRDSAALSLSRDATQPPDPSSAVAHIPSAVTRFTTVALPLLHYLVLVAPHQGRAAGRTLSQFWALLEPHRAQLDELEPVSGMTALQLALVSGRSEMVDWASSGPLSVEKQRFVTVNVQNLKRLYSAVSVRFVNQEALEALVETNGRGGSVAPLAEVIQVTLVELAAALCPAAARQLMKRGFGALEEEMVYNSCCKTVAADPPPSVTSSTDNIVASTTMASSTESVPAIQQQQQQFDRKRSLGSSASLSSTQQQQVLLPRLPSARRSSPLRAKSSGANLRASPSRKGLRTVERARPASALMWKGDSLLHATLRSLARSSKTIREAHSNGNGGEAAAASSAGDSESTSPTLDGRRLSRRSFSAIHFAPETIATPAQQRKRVEQLAVDLLHFISDAIAAALEPTAAEQREGEGETSGMTLADGNGTTAVAMASISPKGSGTAPPELLKLPMFAVDARGSSPLHTLAAAGSSLVLAEYVAVSHQLLDAYARCVVRASTRTPLAVQHAVRDKIQELKADIVLSPNQRHQTALDVMLQFPWTPSWHSVAMSLLEWLPPASKDKQHYSSLVSSKAHLEYLPQLLLSSGLLQQSLAGEASSAAPPAAATTGPFDGHAFFDAQRSVTLFVLGVLYVGFHRQTEVIEIVRRLIVSGASLRTILKLVNPFAIVPVLRLSKLPLWLRYNSKRAPTSNSPPRESSVPTRPVTAGSPQQSQQLPKRPSPAPAAQGSAGGGSRPQTGGRSSALRSVVMSAVVPLPPPVGVTERGVLPPFPALNALSPAEKYALVHSAPVMEEDEEFVTYICEEGRMPVRVASPEFPPSVVEYMDDFAQLIWQQFTAYASEKPSTTTSSNSHNGSGKGNTAAQANNMGAKKSELSGGSRVDNSSGGEHVQLRDSLMTILAAVAYCGWEDVLVAARHRLLCASFSIPEHDRLGVVAAVLLHPNVAVAACRALRPLVLRILFCCGLTTSRLLHSQGPTRGQVDVSDNNSALQNTITYVDEVLAGFKSTLTVAFGSLSAKRVLTATRVAAATRLCIRVLVATRCAISEYTVHQLGLFPHLLDLNEPSPIFFDTFLHLAVMNHCKEAVLALAHSKKFTSAQETNWFGLRAWEYCVDPQLLDLAVKKMAQHILYQAAVVALENAEGKGKSLHAVVPPAVVATLKEHGFVVDDAGSGSEVEGYTGVVKVALPMAVAVRRAANLLGSGAKPRDDANHPQQGRMWIAAAERQGDSVPLSMRKKSLGDDGEGSRARLARECDAVHLPESQRVQVVLLALAEALDEKSIAELGVQGIPPPAAVARNFTSWASAGLGTPLGETPQVARVLKRQSSGKLRSSDVGQLSDVALLLLPLYT